MKLTENVKEQIDAMSYDEMLKKWRFAPIGDTLFQGETGDYFAEVLFKKKSQMEPREHVRVSKELGWES